MAGRLAGAVIAWLGIVMVMSGYARSAPGPEESTLAGVQQGSPAGASSQRGVVEKYCITCHNQRLKTGGLTLDTLLDTLDVEHVAADAGIWEKVIKKVRVGAMPPAGRPRPDQATRARFVSWLETTIDAAARVNPDPGRPIVHRLNRAEYANVIRDLLDVEIDSKSLLPADNTSYGFDNIADVLSLSPSLLDRYVSAARRISRLAIGAEGLETDVVQHKVELLWRQEDRLSDDVPAGSRGGAVFWHYFPADGEYLIKTYFQQGRSGLRGDHAEERIDLRIDGELVKRFMFGGWGKLDKNCSRQSVKCQDSIDELRAQEEAAEDPEWDGVRVQVKAGRRLVSVAFQQRNWAMEGPGPTEFPIVSTSFAYKENTDPQYGKIEMAVETVAIEGPFDAEPSEDTPSHRRIFVCRPASPSDEVPCATTILSGLARRAYRRPVTEKDVENLLGFFHAGREGKTFDAGIERALGAVLVHPEFLFRVERDPAGVAPGAAYGLSDIELASRLSFFLWSTIPDDELLDVAGRGKLRDPEVLDQQVRRMLADHRSRALRENFFGQWLSVRSLTTLKVDPYAFPKFDENLREAFRRETELFLESQFREDRSALDLLTANYTFLNERLARHYGIPKIFGSHFRRVTFEDDRRAGLLGQGSVLMVTSYANRTSPVLRGKWVLDTLLGVPPPPPPPDVPALEEEEEESVPASMRERMEQHRRNPVCANCHAQIDPPGFALENFNAIGEWRDTDGGRHIDSSGVFYGSAFDDSTSFRAALVERQDAFIATLTEKLLTYAVGRGVEHTDMPTVRQAVREAAANDYRWSSLITAIVKSPQFRMRRAAS